MPKPPQPENRPAEPQPLLHREVAPSTAQGRLRATGVGLVDPVAERRRQQAAEPRDVPHRHPEGPHAAVALPDAQHNQVTLRMPADAQPGPALVQEHIPTGRLRWRVVHGRSVAVPGSGFKAPARTRHTASQHTNRVG